MRFGIVRNVSGDASHVEESGDSRQLRSRSVKSELNDSTDALDNQFSNIRRSPTGE